MSENDNGQSSALVETLASEMRKRWQAGDRVLIESLADRVQPITSNHEAVLDLIYHEVLIREEFGETTNLREYVQRFPEYKLRLERLWAIHGAVESGSFLPHATPTKVPPRSAAGVGKRAGDSQSTSTKLASAESCDPPGYEIIREIGHGGMAVVYEARHLSLGRTVAFKMILAGQHATKEMLSRFRQEAQAVAHLQHPNIVQIYEVGEYAGRPFLSLEYMGGGTLHDQLAGRPLPPTAAAQLTELLARTIHFAHECGIVHRDLKPANILLETPRSDVEKQEPPPSRAEPEPFEPRAKIGDFGLAKWFGTGSNLTATGQVVGTPSYMAPEQASGKGEDIGPAVDIYSLGAILYELLTGRPPFQGATVLDTLDQVRSQDPVPLHRLQPKVPRDLETICLKCLDKLPYRRYPTALELAKDLHRFLNHQSISARASGFLERGVKWTRRRPAVAGLLALVAVVSIAGLAGILWQSHRAKVIANQSQRERDTANRLRRVAQQRQAEAEIQRAAAEAARIKADSAKQQAEANLKRTLEAISTLRQLGDQLRQVSTQEITGQRLLDQASILYEDLLSDTNENPVLWYQAASTLNSAGAVAASLGQPEAAEAAFRRAVELWDKLLAEPSGLPHRGDLIFALWYLGNACRDQGKHEQAESVYNRTISVLHEMIADQPERLNLQVDLANTLVNLCTTLKALQRTDEADEKFEEATALLRRVTQQDPQYARGRCELALCLDDHAHLLWQRGRSDAAVPLYQEAFELRKKLIDEYPDDPNFKVLLARSYRSLARCHIAVGSSDDALAAYETARDLNKQLVSELPNAVQMQLELCDTYADLIGCQRTRANREALVSTVRDMIDLLEKLNQRLPKDDRIAGLLSGLLYEDGETLWQEQRMDEARQRFQRCLQLEEKRAATHPDDAYAANTLAWILAVCPCEDLRDIPRSVILAKKAVELSPKTAAIWNTLGVAQYRAGDWSSAIESLDQSVAVANGGEAVDWLFLAMAHSNNGNQELARHWHGRAMEAAAISPPTDLQLRRFYQEATAQMGLTSP